MVIVQERLAAARQEKLTLPKSSALKKALIPISDLELETILEDHKNWLKTKGKLGYQANLSKVNLSGKNLYKVNLSDAILRGTNLESANLEKANFAKASMRGVRLVSANLRGADLRKSELSFADLSHSKLDLARFFHSYCFKTLFQNASIKDTKFTFAKLYAADFSDVQTGEKTLDELLLYCNKDTLIRNDSRARL